MADDCGTTDSRETCPVCAGEPAGQTRVDRAGAVAICGACGSWYRVPRPTPEELTEIYDQDYYNAWGMDQDESIATETKLATFAGVVKHLGRLVARTDGGRPRLLDVGAATGLLLTAAETAGWEPWGIELNPYSAGVLRKRFGEDRIFEGELVDCSFSKESFDGITMTDVIEHVLDVGGTLQKARSLLRPGGVLCITTPRIDSLSRCLMGPRWLHFKIEHIQYLSRAGADRALREAGFEQVSVRGHGKSLSLEYLHAQLQTYPHWLLTPTVSLARRCLPRGLRRRPVYYRCGEMIATARRPG